MTADYNFTLKPAVKEAVPPLIGLWGPSGSGKTYSALLLARGLVGPKGKIAVIDTENGRAKFYADIAGGWFHLPLDPPFSPDKYSAAFRFCEEQGANVIVVDSMSHVWEGEGGVLDQADNIGGSGLHKWKAPKMAHKRMMNNLIRSRLPVIFCVRAKDAVKQVGHGKEAKIIHMGWQPIADKNFVFEMTVDLHLTKDGHYDLATSKTLPTTLREFVKPDGIVNEAMGQAIARWCGDGAAPDEEYERLKREGMDASTKGVEAYKEWVGKLTDMQKNKIRQYHKEWSALAKKADAEKTTETEVDI